MGHSLTWYREGSKVDLSKSRDYEVTTVQDIHNFALVIASVTSQHSGVYLCNVTSYAGIHLITVAKGLNLAGPKQHGGDKVELSVC